MFTLENLKNDKKDIIEKIVKEQGRSGVISFCSQVLDKRAYFTIDMNGAIKRKKMNYVIPSAVFTDEDSDFVCHVVNSINFAEKTKTDKIERMTNAEIEDLKKNIFKLLAKGDFHFTCKYCKELYFKDKENLFKILFQFSLMDNISFEKPLAVYSLKKYFEKFGYSDEALYLTISYLAKMRADFSEYEKLYVEKNNLNSSDDFEILKNELKNIVKNNIDKYKTTKGLEILGYLLVLLSYSYENENIFTAILKREIETFGNETKKDEELTGISVDIFKGLSKEV